MKIQVPIRRGMLATASFALIVGMLGGCGGPFLLLPGGELEGQVTGLPVDWSFTDEISTVQVETRPEDPYSINIWVTALENQLYLHAGANRAAWVEHLEVNSLLRVAIEDSLYEMVVTRVSDASEFARFADAYEVKYGSRPRNEDIAEIYLYRLAGR